MISVASVEELVVAQVRPVVLSPVLLLLFVS